MKRLLLLTLFCILNPNALGLKCYSCTANENDLDQRCISDPGNAPGNNIITCNKIYCTTMRVEYLDPKGKVASMNRDCVDKPTFLNQIIEDSTSRTYFTACQSDLCNGGTGKDISAGDLVSDVGDAIVLVVPGIGVNSASTISYYTILTVIAANCIYHLI